MYGVILIVHSWNRWLVLVTAVAALVAAISGLSARREWSKKNQRVALAFIGSLDLQALLGLLLYFVLSPLIPKTSSEFKAAMHVGALRFFAIEHITMMLLALIVAHGAWAYAKRARDSRARQKRVAWGFGIALLLILSSIPWPGMPASRPLFHWI
ncbi:MAG TPA: hypothetical protein VER11_01550 [Polyangiaceae bacterium]|nr:hypothetical protein [Polyangiaceae bacterium]